MKRKICVYVTEDLVSRLAVAAEHRGATKSGLVGAALDRFLDVAEEPDEHLAQMSQQLAQLARELRFVNETVAMHARYHLTITPPLPGRPQMSVDRIPWEQHAILLEEIADEATAGREPDSLDILSIAVAPRRQ